MSEDKLKQDNSQEDLDIIDEGGLLTEEEQEETDQGKWYVIHTFSGYENKVKEKLERLMQNKPDCNIYKVFVPMEKYMDIKDNQRVMKERKLFPGYVLVKMDVNPSSWYLVRNTNGVTGFVGPDSDPVALTASEVAKFGQHERPKNKPLEVHPGDNVQVIRGPFTGFLAKVEGVDNTKSLVHGLINMFGRETAVELSFDDIEVDQ